jgi:release factor glutamine methyltransferase
MAYILGYKHFWKYKFFTNNSVLIPRPDTELIVEETLKYIPINQSKKILDVGTGSGCIVISLLKDRPKCKATALDISIKAINVAKTNAKLHHLENKINFININIDKYNSYNYDLVISNPPYINSIDLNRLDDDIKFHEPRLALSGGSDGFRDLKKVIKKSRELLKINGKLILEIGSGQKDKVIRLLNKYCYYVNTVSKDLSGNDRCIISTKLK